MEELTLERVFELEPGAQTEIDRIVKRVNEYDTVWHAPARKLLKIWLAGMPTNRNCVPGGLTTWRSATSWTSCKYNKPQDV